MKRLSFLWIFLIITTVSLRPFTAYAFNPGGHLYIAENVFEGQDINLYYGAIAPDISSFVADPQKWETAFWDTHYQYIDLTPYAWGFNQKTFAQGWLTHNEAWGADHYAHVVNPLGNNICATQGYYRGYVAEKACFLSSSTGIKPEFAHYAIETAIDLLLRNNDDPRLGEKLFYADLLRSQQDLGLLLKVLVFKEKKTDWMTLTTAELAFRYMVYHYAMALALPDPLNKIAMARLGSEIALERYGIVASPGKILSVLENAILLCRGDYKEVVDFAIGQIKGKIE